LISQKVLCADPACVTAVEIASTPITAKLMENMTAPSIDTAQKNITRTGSERSVFALSSFGSAHEARATITSATSLCDRALGGASRSVLEASLAAGRIRP
jgi:hypothetical protein